MSIPIYHVRGQAVAFANDIAPLFEVKTARLNQQVKRNLNRFSDGYAFQLTDAEWEVQRSHITTFNAGRLKYPPWAFTEHGVVMAATLLRSETAVRASRMIVETFVAARRTAQRGTNRNIAVAPSERMPVFKEPRQGLLRKLDAAVGRVLDAIADPEENTTIREEARALAMDGLGAIKAQLNSKKISNEKTLAEVQKLLKEAEALDAEIEARSIEAEHRKLAYLAKQLRVVIALQSFVEHGEKEDLMAVLKDLSS